MKVTVCLLVGMDAPSRATAQRAARLVFPEAILKDCNALEEALNHKAASGGELLVYANPERESLARAVEATDGSGLRRWAIVVLGAAPAVRGAEIISPQEWGELLLAHAFRSAVVQHQLICENERLKGDLRTLASQISHDLRTPLGGILSTGEVLTEMLAEHDPSNTALTKPLFDSVDDLRKLIDRVSALLKASVYPVAKETVAMGDVVWAVLQRQERGILKKGAVVTQPDWWPEVEAVFSWMEVLWGNLVGNALQHGKAVTRIELGWSQNAQEFRFWVSDNGDGMPSGKMESLFRPFHLLHHPDAEKGLGLTIVQRLSELQGGNCGYEPASNGGSTFFFTLPKGKGADEGSPPSATLDSNVRPATPA